MKKVIKRICFGFWVWALKSSESGQSNNIYKILDCVFHFLYKNININLKPKPKPKFK